MSEMYITLYELELLIMLITKLLIKIGAFLQAKYVHL